MADFVGQQFGNYRLVSLIGEGGFAQVYLGEHLYLKTEAAIKILQLQLAKDDMEDFLKEAQTIARLRHAHIVRVLEFGIENKTPYLVMDYASNGTMRQRYPKGKTVDLPTISASIKQVAEALQYAHQQKVVHRDVKPENMLLGAHDEVLLSDFGIAISSHSSHSQHTLEAAGTVAYMAPEQIQGHPRPASDQYSLGIVIYEWLGGERPFRGSFTELCTQHLFASPPPLREKVPTLPSSVEEVVLTALAKDPNERFATIQAFAYAFGQACLSDSSLLFAVTRPVSSPIPTPQTPSTPTPGTRFTPDSSILPQTGPTALEQTSQPTPSLYFAPTQRMGDSAPLPTVPSTPSATPSTPSQELPTLSPPTVVSTPSQELPTVLPSTIISTPPQGLPSAPLTTPTPPSALISPLPSAFHMEPSAPASPEGIADGAGAVSNEATLAGAAFSQSQPNLVVLPSGAIPSQPLGQPVSYPHGFFGPSVPKPSVPPRKRRVGLIALVAVLLLVILSLSTLAVGLGRGGAGPFAFLGVTPTRQFTAPSATTGAASATSGTSPTAGATSTTGTTSTTAPTATSTPGSSGSGGPQPTNTPRPGATATPTPYPTSTPVPAPTSTPQPAAGQLSVGPTGSYSDGACGTGYYVNSQQWTVTNVGGQTINWQYSWSGGFAVSVYPAASPLAPGQSMTIYGSFDVDAANPSFTIHFSSPNGGGTYTVSCT